MNLFETKTEHDFDRKADMTYCSHNSKVDYVTFCKCGGYGTRNQYGRDDYCPKCGKSLFKGKGGLITCPDTSCGYSFKAPRKNAKKAQDDDNE